MIIHKVGTSEITLQPGTYVVAVSGGVDSMVLLDMLRKKPDLKLVVAHYDHGIRPDSAEDRKLVQSVAQRHGLQFVYNEGKLGPHASEAKARESRYRFLKRVQQAANAKGIITAHHQDDVIETAILNMLRGTGRHGLTALKSRDNLVRPLVDKAKQELIAYAKEHGLQWREDITNEDTRYLRNYIRHKLLPKFGDEAKKKLLSSVARLSELNDEVDTLLVNQLHMQPKRGKIERYWFIMLPHEVAREMMAVWLRTHNKSFDRRTLERLVRAAKVLKPGKVTDIDSQHVLGVTPEHVLLLPSS